MRTQRRSGAMVLGLAALALVLGASSNAQAGVIYTQGQITGPADVLNIGTVVVANNLGAGATPVTINGVAFGNSSAGISGMVNGTGDFSNQFPPGSPLDMLLSGLVDQTGTTSSLTLSGLIPGQDYLLQLFLSNVVNSTGKTSRITIQGQADNILNFGNNADFIRADFIAYASTEVVTFGKGSGIQSDRMVLNAYALEAVAAVPEPSSLALLTLGGVALAGWRRWKKRSVA